MGLNFEREDFRREAALAKEQERVAKKEAKCEKMMNRSSYRIMVKTAKLTLAVIYNVLLGVLIGAIPFVGNVLDIFKRSYLNNLRLITGYIEDDKEIISKVRKKALATAVLIAIVCALLCLVVKLALMVATWFS